MSIDQVIGSPFSTRALARALAQHGRNGDSILAHITPREAEMLKKRGGSGTINPQTGLPEFFDFSFDQEPSNYVENYTPPSSSSSSFDYTPPSSNYVENQQPSSGGDTFDWGLDTSQLNSGDKGGGVDTTNFSSWLDNQVGGGAPVAPSQQPMQAPASPGVISPAEPLQQQTVPETAAPTQEQRSVLDRVGDWANKNPGWVKALGAGSLGLVNRMQMNSMRRSGDKASNDLRALGAPFQQQGNALITAAQNGQLTPQMQQQLQALRAKTQQDLMRSGASAGTASLQAEAAVQQQAQQFAQQLMQQGMQLVQAGNSYAAQAVQAGYAADQQAQATAADFYKEMARLVSGSGGKNAAPTTVR
jgi:hypothetical protein